MDPIRIEITPVEGTADEQTLTQRAQAVQRLHELGQIDATAGAVNTQQTSGWQATVNGTPMPLAGYAIEPDDDGRVLVSLVVVADQVSAHRSPTATPAPGPAPTAEKPKRSTWGDPTAIDPRENIPGWAPGVNGNLAVVRTDIAMGQASLGEQVARNAETTA